MPTRGRREEQPALPLLETVVEEPLVDGAQVPGGKIGVVDKRAVQAVQTIQRRREQRVGDRAPGEPGVGRVREQASVVLVDPQILVALIDDGEQRTKIPVEVVRARAEQPCAVAITGQLLGLLAEAVVAIVRIVDRQ